MQPKAISITIILIQLLWASSFSIAQNVRKALVSADNYYPMLTLCSLEIP